MQPEYKSIKDTDVLALLAQRYKERKCEPIFEIKMKASISIASLLLLLQGLNICQELAGYIHMIVSAPIYIMHLWEELNCPL